VDKTDAKGLTGLLALGPFLPVLSQEQARKRLEKGQISISLFASGNRAIKQARFRAKRKPAQTG